MQYMDIFSAVKIENFIRKILIFFFFYIYIVVAQNIDCGHTEVVLTSTHKLCFG